MFGLKALKSGSKTFVMGVINVTPDSFSGDGVGSDLEALNNKVLNFIRDGADILDVGGESTRPPSLYEGVVPVSSEEELKRIIPAISSITSNTNVPVSIDTYKAEVALAAIHAGASIVNDIWGLQKDPGLAAVVADTGVGVVLTHNTKTPCYKDVVQDTVSSLLMMVDDAVKKGVKKESIVIDPGIGFGKNANQNLEILRRLDEYKVVGRPIMVGTSRKSTIGKVLDLPVEERLEGTAATVALAISKGADIVRVHDVKEMARVSRMSDAIVRGWKQ